MSEKSELDLAIESGAEWLEEDGPFDRYMIAVDEDGDGVSQWYCNVCGSEVHDLGDGCETCNEG